jgi:membrane protein DedA with SNARE-associated domain
VELLEWLRQFAETWLEWLRQFAETPNHPLGLLLLSLSAFVEYVFPPFPGDTVTLFGAILVGKWGWSFPLVFLAVTMGSAVGIAVDFLVGSKLHAWREGKEQKADRAVRWILDGFRRRGIWLIALNRFFPGIRAFFFVAAGMAGFSFWPVVALGALSAVAWNLIIVGVGVAIGGEFDTLVALVGKYQLVVWILIAVGLSVGLVVIRRRRRARA